MTYDYSSSYSSAPPYTTAASSPPRPTDVGDGHHYAHPEPYCDGRCACLAVANIYQGWQARLGCPHPYLQYRCAHADHRSA